MEYYLFQVIALLVLAVAGISVGVANDAVNFLNSSMGSKVSSFRVIMIIASLGILAGVTFSSGMMEVARKGIFNPEYFVIGELLIIFFAVVIQNVLLLDLFNTFGLPTSTTVSVVFGLLGAALAVSLIKIYDLELDFNQIYNYINTGKVLAIISAIFISVVFAFIFGSVSQYISRLIFTFNYEKTIKRYGGIWGGLALTAITYFIVIKGAKGSSFLTADVVEWITTHTWEVVLFSWLLWFVVLQVLISVFKVNIFKIIVLVGTFALAMAFAANDLVNFIGAPLAGLNAYTVALDFADPSTMPMSELTKPFQANTLILLSAGLVMVLTLLFSKKARSVSKTEINLGRQDEGYERFQSYMASRIIVRMSIASVDFVHKITPNFIKEKINKRTNLDDFKEKIKNQPDAPAFDLVRAAVNLVVASALISYGTSLKLPLSTTYVTFIVAMATALPDKAWGRESAVYRVSGVLTVVGGWFFTAFVATIIAGSVAAVVYFGDVYATAGFLLLSAFLIYRSTKTHKNREKAEKEKEDHFLKDSYTDTETAEFLFGKITEYLKSVEDILTNCLDGVRKNKLKSLNKAKKQAKKLYKDSDFLVSDVLKSLKFASESQLDQGHNYAKSLGALHEMSSRLQYITKQCFDYFDNNHHKFQNEQIDELRVLSKEFKKVMGCYITAFENKDLALIDNKECKIEEFEELVAKCNKNQLKRIQKSGSNKKRSILFLNIFDDTHGIILNLTRVSKSFSDFYSG